MSTSDCYDCFDCYIQTIQSKPHEVWFGKVPDDKFRGQEELLANPPFSHIDNFFWLRDDSRTNKEILQIINQENCYTDCILSPHKNLQTQIFQELKGYMKEDYLTFPIQEHSVLSPFKYFKEFTFGSGYYKYNQIDTRNCLVKTLLDINLLAEGKPQCDVTSLSCSLDEKYFSYCVDFNGSEKYKLVIQTIETELCVDSKQIDTSVIPLISYGDYAWIGSNQIVYTQCDESNKPCEIWTWIVGSSKPKLIYEEKVQDLSVEFSISSDLKYLFISSSNYDSTSIQYGLIGLLGKDKFELTKITGIIPGLKYSVQHLDGYFYIKNNLNAINWKVSKVPISQVQNLNSWIDFIPANKNVYIKSFVLTRFNSFVLLKINGGTYLGFIVHKTNIMYITNCVDYNKTIKLTSFQEFSWSQFWPQSVYTLGIYSYFWDSEKIYLSMDTMSQPYSLIEFDPKIKSGITVYTKEVPGHNGSLYESKRIYTQTSDGKAVPISLIYKKGTSFPAPTYLYGYGSYGNTIEPNFDYEILPLLNRGWVYAIAHVRGGSFLGYDWYLQGKGRNKLNTFNDFISCAEHLINFGYALPNSITSDGRSAGGLLVGASMVLRPELFKNVIMDVPFLDVLNTMVDSSIPLTIEEWTQWGNPNIKSDYDYMRLYCPYTNLKPGVKYPNIFATGGLHDPRVQYWEPLKFISKLRSFKNPTDKSVQNLKIEMTQGHFGGSDRYKNLKETAEKYTWVFTRDLK
jgi:oligopeptidase B